MDTIWLSESAFCPILCIGQNRAWQDMTNRAQLLERRVQVAMANLAELGLEKIDIDE